MRGDIAFIALLELVRAWHTPQQWPSVANYDRRGRSSERGAQSVEYGRHLVHEFVSIGSGESRALNYIYKFWDFVPSGFAGRPSLELWIPEV